MAGFLYYLSGLNGTIAPAELARHGLGHAFEPGRGLSCRGVHGGPDHRDGLIVADALSVPAEQVGYYPDLQSWHPIPGAAAWAGLIRDARPGPADLARANPLRGHWIALDDGKSWLAPMARAFTEEDGELRWQHALPRQIELDQSGQWHHGEVMPRFLPLWDLAVQWEETRFSAVGQAARTDAGNVHVEMQFSDLIQGAVEALAANYRLGPAEVALLRLLSQQQAVEVLDALIDLPTRLDWLKKKADADPAGTTTGAGPAGSTPSTGPP